MTARKTLRVWFVTHLNGLRTGILIRRWDQFFDAPPPSAIGTSEEDVLRQLEVIFQQRLATKSDRAERYLWEEEFHTREVAVSVHPQTVSKKRAVIGERDIPLRLTFAWCELAKGGYRVMLPRFGWWFVLETLSIAPEVLRGAVGNALLGENANTIYDFRREGDEWAQSWSPKFLRDDAGDVDPDDDMPTVRQVSDEWVERAARGKLPAVVGVDAAFERAAPMFDATPPPSVLLVGPTGAGKTAWVRRLARRLLQRRRDNPDHYAPRLWATSATRLIAGMVYVGMWQERALALVRELSHEGDVLYVDRLVPLLQPQSDGGSIGEVLIPPAAEGLITLLAECTTAEYESCRRRFPSLLEAFQVVRVDEPARGDAAALLSLYAQRRLPQVELSTAAMRRMVHHLAGFQRDAAFPGKGVRFVDWLATQQESTTSPKHPTPSQVSELFARYSGLPVDLVADERRVMPGALADVLRRSVIGQDHACAVSARVLARFKAGMNDPERPVGTLLFVGPTGVGKTELARALARYMFGDEQRMVRLDMSEYMFPGSAQRLLTVGAGVTSLAQRVREQPLSLVLLDEVEKAHPEVFDLLLGVLGEGRLTDSFGTTVDFRMALVVMTSNLGVEEHGAVGFSDVASGAPEGAVRAVRQHFRPEFFNRIDHVIGFRALDRDDVLRIVDLELARAAARTGLVRRQLTLQVDGPTRARLAELGWHPTRGARPLKRVIEERVMAPVAELLARETELRGRALVVDAEGGVRVV